MCEIWGSHGDDLKNIFPRGAKPFHLLENTDRPGDDMTSTNAGAVTPEKPPCLRRQHICLRLKHVSTEGDTYK